MGEMLHALLNVATKINYKTTDDGGTVAVSLSVMRMNIILVIENIR